MKKILSILLALALMLGATFALAEGNVTIAVQGMNDFNDYIQSMVVYGDRLLLSSWDTLYTWDNTSRKLTPVEGYDKLQNVLTGDGETPGVLELNDGEYAYLDGNLYAVGGKLYRQGDTIDLRGGEVSIAEYDELRARFPDSVILWNVPIGSRSFDSSSTSVSVDNYSEAEIDSFRYLPQLKTIDASDADCYDVIMKTIDAYPNCTVKYQVKLGGSAYAGDTAQLVLDSPAALSELEARLQYFPQLESVDLRAAGLGDDEEDALIDAFPDISFLREVELAGKSFDTSAAELDLSGTDIDVQTLVSAAPRFTGTETVELGSRELSFDDIEAVRDAFGGAAVHCKLRVYGTQVDSFAEELNYNGQSRIRHAVPPEAVHG